VKQAGLRPGQSCSYQVLSLTIYIEVSFRKTAVVLIDLTATYDTVWRQPYIRTICCRYTIKLINTMLTNRSFKVHIDDKTSNLRTLNNGLAQGLV